MTREAQSQDQVTTSRNKENKSFPLNKQSLNLRNCLGIQRRQTTQRVDYMGGGSFRNELEDSGIADGCHIPLSRA